MDDVTGLEVVAAGDFGLAGAAAIEHAAFGQQLVSCGAMNGTVHTATAEEGGVGGIDDGIDVEGGDVGLESCEDGIH